MAFFSSIVSISHRCSDFLAACPAPGGFVKPYLVDLDDYEFELAQGMQVIWEEVRAKNEAYQDRMKKYYEARHNVDVNKLPQVGKRVFIRLSREKQSSKHSKLTVDWDGQDRLVQTSDCYDHQDRS